MNALEIRPASEGDLRSRVSRSMQRLPLRRSLLWDTNCPNCPNDSSCRRGNCVDDCVLFSGRSYHYRSMRAVPIPVLRMSFQAARPQDRRHVDPLSIGIRTNRSQGDPGAGVRTFSGITRSGSTNIKSLRFKLRLLVQLHVLSCMHDHGLITCTMHYLYCTK